MAEDVKAQALLAQIAETIKYASLAESQYVRLDHLHEPNTYDEEYDDVQNGLKRHLKQGFRECAMLAEFLGMPNEAEKIRDLYTRLENKGLLNIDVDYGTNEQYCVGLAELSSTVEPLRALLLGGDNPNAIIVETILTNSGKIIEDQGIYPRSEKDVKDAVFSVLKYVFNDARREQPIAQQTKSYQADISIKSQHILIEYKYAREKDDIKKLVDEIVSDTKGYSGNPHWRRMYAVFYCAGAFCTQKDLQSIFDEWRLDPPWRPIVVQGRGAKPSASKIAKKTK